MAKYEALLKEKDAEIMGLETRNETLQGELMKWTAENARKHDNIRQASSKIEALLKIKEEEEI